MSVSIFVSFRFDPDLDFAERIARLAKEALKLKLGNSFKDEEVFFASDSIRAGQDFRDRYASAIIQAKLIVLCVSETTISKFVNASTKEDSVLHEWELALQQLACHSASVIPLLLPSVILENGRQTTTPFHIPKPGTFPSAPHAGGLGNPISTTVEEIFKLLALHIYSRSDEKYINRTIIPDLMEALSTSLNEAQVSRLL